MFQDPMTLIPVSTAIDLPAVSRGDGFSTYANVAEGYKVSIKHTGGKRRRSVFRIDFADIVVDPLQAGRNVPASASCYLVLDAPQSGFTVPELRGLFRAMGVWMDTTPGSNVDRFIAGES